MRSPARALIALLLIATLLLPAAATPPTANAASKLIRWGYVVTYDAGSTASFKANAGSLDIVSPGYFSVEADGRIVGGDVADISSTARRHGVKLVPMIQNKAQYADLTPVLADPVLRARTTGALCELTQTHNYDGLNLDFEAIRPEDKDGLTAFYSELSSCLRSRGKLVTIAVPSRVSDAAGVWSAPYDFARLGELSDYVVIMTYAFRTAANYAPGSISPIDQVVRSAAYTRTQMPAGKILLGIGLWGYDWNTSSPGRATTRKHPETMTLAQRFLGTLGYDSGVQSAWLKYSDSGASREVWFEDRQAVIAKTGVAQQQGLGGVAFWRIGQEDPAIWPYFASLGASGPADYEIPGGRFFSQTGGGAGRGYRVIDGGQDPAGQTIRFWSEFRRLGGIDTLGYPVSQRYVGPGGFTYQAFQRAVLQWRPDANCAYLANTFDQLTEAGKDTELAPLGIPPAASDDGSGGDWQRARATRLGWLTDPAIKARFYARPGSVSGWNEDAAIQLYGLPASAPVRSGPFVVQRFQRIALQLWVESVPGMPAKGSVVGILGGDLLKERGLIPADAALPES